jgi:two-component system sensor histidine kinase BaeS
MRWSLSYRVRAIVLVALLTGAAIAATAWVSARSTVAQLSDSVDSQQDDINLIAQQLRNYGAVHGVWAGIPTLTLALERETAQRIRLTTQDGQVVVDTDTLHGRTARATPSRSPVAIVPRPTIDLTGMDLENAFSATLEAIRTYRANVRMAACLTQAGIAVGSSPGTYGIDDISYNKGVASEVGCLDRPPIPAEGVADKGAAKQCGLGPALSGRKDPESVTTAMIDKCLSVAFQQRTAADDAVTLLLYTGVRGGPALHLQSARIALAAIPILLLAIILAALLSRHVLRPVDAVIRASQRLEAGHRTTRVVERGHDEMTALARAFNQMADSVQTSDDRQRQMAADIAHELRTPLANIRGYLEALKDGVMAPTVEVFESLHEEALLQQRTIDDLQDLALADRHQLIHHRVRTALGELTRTARAVHAARADAAGVRLEHDVEEGLFVDADPDRLRQAIANLLTNALRASEPGGRIVISARRADRSHLRIDVADSGHGIAAEHLPYIFDRFWRADPARARDTGGTGLGLAITAEIIRGHGGTIDVTSILGRGTTFTVTLPAASP